MVTTIENNQVLEDSMPYADKQEKAKRIAKQLMKTSDLGRELELEVIAEDDKVLAEIVKNELDMLVDEKKKILLKLSIVRKILKSCLMTPKQPFKICSIR